MICMYNMTVKLQMCLYYATKCITLVKSCQGGAGRWACDGIMEHPTLLIGLIYYRGGKYETRPGWQIHAGDAAGGIL